jgi:AcrR family transcriptional regulator
VDRRIQKTRQAIMNTFVDLLTEKVFDKITINDIADRANINRGTVYLHYEDKFDLLDKCIEIYIEPLLQHRANTAETETNAIALQSMFEYLEKNFTIYKLFLSNEVARFFRNRLYSTIAQAIAELNAPKSENNALSYGVTIHFLTSGFIGVLEWWINNSMPCNVQEITDQLMFLIEPYAKNLISS